MSRLSALLPSIAAAILCLPLAGCGAAPASGAEPAGEIDRAPPSKAFIWRAVHPQRPGKVVHLLGSVHVGREDIYPLDRAIVEPFEGSDALVVEVNLQALEPAALLVLVFTRALLPEGETLRDRLSPEAWTALEQAAERMGLPLLTFLPYEPWFVAMNLLVLRNTAGGFDPTLGIDMHFLELAEGRMEILELETAALQIDLFDSMPPEVQELMLLDAIDGEVQTTGDLDRLLDLWEAGDADGLERAVLDAAAADSRFEPLMRRMMIDRNHTMTVRIEELAQERDSLFVVVGAGHVVGDEGIVALLERKGWTVTQLDKLGR